MKIVTIILLASAHLAMGQPDTTTWIVTLGETNAGFLKKWKTPDGISHEWFQFNDRGRGDSTVCSYREDDKGFVTWLDAGGKDYLKKPVFEKFNIENGTAYWENNSEKGSTRMEKPAMYYPLKVSFGTTLRQYFASPDSSVALLPAGRQKLGILRTHILPSGKKIFLYRLSGADMLPTYGWMDSDFESIGFVSDWLSIVPEDLLSEKNKLFEIQTPVEAAYLKQLKKSLTQAPKRIAITHADIFDTEKKVLVPNQTILIEDGTIKEITGNEMKLPKDVKIIEAAGKFVMPGLWDMHVHYSPGGADGITNVAFGITNVRDMGNSDELLDARKELADGLVIGPRIQMMCGFIDGAGPFAGPVGSKINSAEEGIQEIKKYAALGYQQIKLYSSLKPEWIKSLTAEAKKHNMRVSGHIPANMLASEAVESGYDEIQHMNMIFLNFYGKEIDTRTPLRFTTVAQKAAFFDFKNPEFLKFISLLKTKNIAVDPTVSIFERMFTHSEGQPTPASFAVIDRLPVTLQRAFRSGRGLSIPNGLEETYRKSFDNMLRMIKVLYDAGVPILVGTDDHLGFPLHREMENYVKAGIPNNEVLKMATLTAATVANQSKLFGKIRVNTPADLIIIDGNPLKDINDIRKVTTVIQDKNLYETKALFEAVSIIPK